MVFEHYFPIRAALASDKLEGIREHATELGQSADPDIARAAIELAQARDIGIARRRFGTLSRAILAFSGRDRESPAHFVFECTMAKPFGGWIQDTKETGNPYFGSSMLRCGTLVSGPAASR